MNIEDIINEFGIDIAIEKIIPEIKEKVKKYLETKDENIKKELAELLNDRDKIYSNDTETIRKYVTKK